ncbi:MAG: FHA domain-containing protein [Actinobacteria bacterium]|nr:FHA domain-containing protein [Actinomycetota bacterium]
MSEQLLTILKFCLLALLYLFFLRVIRSVWVEISGPKQKNRPAPVPAGGAPAVAPGAAAARGGGGNGAAPRARGRKTKRGGPSQLVVVDPQHLRGTRYQIGQEMTVGRAPGCGVVVDDTYASQVHARVFARDGHVMVEDLGSTNGTLLNGERVGGPRPMQRGDRLQVGRTVLEVA